MTIKNIMRKSLYLVVAISAIIIAVLEFQAHNEKVEQQNLLGICAKTGTNLYQTLGKEAFYELIKRNYVAYLQKQIKDYISEHHEVCARRDCGLYYIAPASLSLEALLEDYQGKFKRRMKQYWNPDRSVSNYVMTHEMAQPMALDSKIDAKDGYFYFQGFRSGTIYLLKEEVKDNFFTEEELLNFYHQNSGGKSVRQTDLERRRQGEGNFYIRIVSIGLNEYSNLGKAKLDFFTEKLVPVSNCGDF